MYDDPATGPLPNVGDGGDVSATLDPSGTARPSAIGEDRSPNAWVCPFLRSIDDADALGLPVEAPDPANRCAALREAVPQSLRQQELVCLTSGHVNCPRYLRGSLGGGEPPVRVPKPRAVTPAMAGSLAVLAVAFLVSVAFVVTNGGLVLTAAVPPTGSGGAVAVLATQSPTPAPTATPIPTPASTPLASPTESPIPTPSAAPSPSPTPAPPATPAPTPKPTAKPTSNRYALLKPCPDAPNCYLYVIRSGDNLYSIANYFGVPLGTIKSMNPWTANGLKVGRALRLPPPTR